MTDDPFFDDETEFWGYAEDATGLFTPLADDMRRVDADSFYCSIGEAVNGPGGYFGWNLDAVR